MLVQCRAASTRHKNNIVTIPAGKRDTGCAARRLDGASVSPPTEPGSVHRYNLAINLFPTTLDADSFQSSVILKLNKVCRMCLVH